MTQKEGWATLTFTCLSHMQFDAESLTYRTGHLHVFSWSSEVGVSLCMSSDQSVSLQLSEYVLEASDFQGEYGDAHMLRYKDKLLGRQVPAIPLPDNCSNEALQEKGHRDLREYHVHLYLSHIAIEHPDVLDAVL